MYMKKVKRKVFPKPNTRRFALISVFLSHTPVYTARPRERGYASRGVPAYLRPSFRW